MKFISFFLIFSLFSFGLTARQKSGDNVSESEILLSTKTGGISGTLTVPVNAQNIPVVIIIPGSGPTDRDCNSPLGVQTNAYKMIAQGLADNGIAAVRFDKRGIGKSKSAMKSEDELRFETYINDVVDWISYLKQDKRFSKIILLGHSEGSLIGMIAAQKANVNAFISVAGVAKSADDVLREQIKGKLPPQQIIESNKILDSLKNGKQVLSVNPGLVALFRPSVQPYMISWIKYNPSKEISKLKIPVLILQGNTDLQVPSEHAGLLQAAKPDAKIKIFDQMNHVLKESSEDLQTNLATYKNPELPLKAGLMEEMAGFIKALR